MGSPIIFFGNAAKLLKSKLDFSGQASIESGATDPSSVATAGNKGSLYLNTSNGNTYQKTDSGTTTNWTAITPGGGGAPEVVVLRDVKSTGTSGGTFNAGGWQTRDLNTLENPMSVTWASLSSNQFTLNTGVYLIQSKAPAWNVAIHQSRIYDITNGTRVINSNGWQDNHLSSSSISTLEGTLTVSGTTVYELQHYCTITSASEGFGYPANFGDPEVYSTVIITKLG